MAQQNGWFLLESRPSLSSLKAENSINSPAPPVNEPKVTQPKEKSNPPANTSLRPTEAKENQENQENQLHLKKEDSVNLPSEVPKKEYSPNLPAEVPKKEYSPNLPAEVPKKSEMVSTPAPEYKPVKNNLPENPSGSEDALSLWASDRIIHTRHSQTVGSRGPVLKQDSLLHETLETFIHTKILERPVHVKGFGAFGTFETTHAMGKYTKLSFLQTPGQQVSVMVRFSLASSNKGTPDTSRNVRGFSTKFYTRQGVFDLLCNHLPVLLVRDGVRFPEAFTSLEPSPVNNLIDPERFWKFAARAPEATHFVTWLYSDAGTIKSLRHIRGFSVNTFVWRNENGVRRYVKYHWIPLQGEETIDRQEAARLAAANPNIAGQDLYDAIAAGNAPGYELRVQLMDPGDEASLPYDPLDCTKVWDEQRYPLLPVGRMVLNRNPENYMEQVEKVAFSPSNLLEGAELSDDKLLQARANIYWDSQRHRLGQGFRSIPVNHQENWTPDEQITSGTGRQVDGQLVRAELPNPDNFTQAGQRYRSLSPVEQNHLVDNLAADLAVVSNDTRNTVLGYFRSASTELEIRVREEINSQL